MASLSNRHKAFVKFYTTRGQEGFLNATKSYKLVYPQAKQGTAERNGYALRQREDIKRSITEAMKPIYEMSKGDYLDILATELENCTQPGTRARLIELMGKVHNHLKDKEIQTTINNIDIKDVRAELDKRRALLE